MFAQHNPQCELACEADPLEAVCDKQGTEISSKGCLAKCHGYAENEFSAQYCADGYRDAKLCKCDVPTAKDKPVCNSKASSA